MYDGRIGMPAFIVLHVRYLTRRPKDRLISDIPANMLVPPPRPRTFRVGFDALGHFAQTAEYQDPRSRYYQDLADAF